MQTTTTRVNAADVAFVIVHPGAYPVPCGSAHRPILWLDRPPISSLAFRPRVAAMRANAPCIVATRAPDLPALGRYAARLVSLGSRVALVALLPPPDAALGDGAGSRLFCRWAIEWARAAGVADILSADDLAHVELWTGSSPPRLVLDPPSLPDLVAFDSVTHLVSTLDAAGGSDAFSAAALVLDFDAVEGSAAVNVIAAPIQAWHAANTRRGGRIVIVASPPSDADSHRIHVFAESVAKAAAVPVYSLVVFRDSLKAMTPNWDPLLALPFGAVAWLQRRHRLAIACTVVVSNKLSPPWIHRVAVPKFLTSGATVKQAEQVTVPSWMVDIRDTTSLTATRVVDPSQVWLPFLTEESNKTETAEGAIDQGFVHTLHAPLPPDSLAAYLAQIRHDFRALNRPTAADAGHLSSPQSQSQSQHSQQSHPQSQLALATMFALDTDSMDPAAGSAADSLAPFPFSSQVAEPPTKRRLPSMVERPSAATKRSAAAAAAAAASGGRAVTSPPRKRMRKALATTAEEEEGTTTGRKSPQKGSPQKKGKRKRPAVVLSVPVDDGDPKEGEAALIEQTQQLRGKRRRPRHQTLQELLGSPPLPPTTSEPGDEHPPPPLLLTSSPITATDPVTVSDSSVTADEADPIIEQELERRAAAAALVLPPPPPPRSLTPSPAFPTSSSSPARGGETAAADGFLDRLFKPTTSDPHQHPKPSQQQRSKFLAPKQPQIHSAHPVAGTATAAGNPRPRGLFDLVMESEKK
ncbi:hypothetical protein BC828DRAFT_232090 [Blastocladiella britannica]|nr:hypothetical protein BC828DRAFT_232090 [Blastocladiella britannica]